MSRNFSSDHIVPACDAIMAAVNAANLGAATSYGGDDLTARLQKRLGERAVIASERLMGLILTVIAVQMMLSGFRTFLTQLPRA